jgi:ferritin
MLKETIQKAMNEQIKHELYSSYLYLSMAAYCESIALPGFAHWLTFQAQEEVEHAMKFYGFIHERGGRVTLMAIEQPPAEFGTPLDIFEQTLEHEQKVTALINDLYALAIQEDDYASQIFLQWFIEEQVEEEATATEILDMLKRTGDQGQALLMMDRQLGERQGA